MMRRDPVTLAWGIGLVLAVIAYLVGPADLLVRLSDGFDEALFRISAAIGDLSLVARDLVRALALGLYATFVVLAAVVLGRGGRAGAILFWVSVLFFLLIGRVGMLSQSNGRWVLALLLAGWGAATMTHRVRQVWLLPR